MQGGDSQGRRRDPCPAVVEVLTALESQSRLASRFSDGTTTSCYVLRRLRPVAELHSTQVQATALAA